MLWLIYSAEDGIDPSEIENVSGTRLGRNGQGFRWAEGAQFPSSRIVGLNLATPSISVVAESIIT